MTTGTPTSQPGAAEARERSNLLAITSQPEAMRTHDLLARQFDVLQARSAVLLTFCAVVITTTGFSGRLIAGTNRLAQALINAGVFLVLAAAWVVLRGVLRVRWVTLTYVPQEPGSIDAILRERNRRGRILCGAILLAMLGMSLYVGAIAIMLALPDAAAVSPGR